MSGGGRYVTIINGKGHELKESEERYTERLREEKKGGNEIIIL